MFRNSYQRGFLTVFFSCGSKPLELWDVHLENGHISRFLDQDIKAMVLEIRGTNVSTAYMTCPTNKRNLGITMPYMIMVVKNLNKYFTFEVTILDDSGARRRFRVANFQSTTQILPMSTAMPIGLADGWNQIQFNLSEFTRRAYNKGYVEVQQIKINANIRLRRIYFAEKLVNEEDLPAEYRIFLPMPSKIGRGKKAVGEGSKTAVKQASKEIMTSQSKLEMTSRASIVELPPGAPGPPPGEEAPLMEEIVENTAGEGESTTGEGGADVGEGEATAGKSEVTVGEGEATAGKSEATVGEGEANAGKSEANVGEGEAAVGKSDAAVVEGEANAGKSEATVGEGEAAVGKSDATVVEGEANAGKSEATVGEGETAGGKSEATVGDGEAPAAVEVPAEESAPGEGDVPSEAPPEQEEAQEPTEDAPAQAADDPVE